MSDLEVSIVDLPPMRVASALGYGTQPEGEAWRLILEFAAQRDIDLATARFFGFNNPSPSPHGPHYGYEQWITVGPEVEGTDAVEIKERPGGRYAVTTFQGLEHITATWQALVRWFEDSGLARPVNGEECLEELHSPNVGPPATWVFDLYLPVAE
jgi:effector-binding domain-containing protein